MAVRSHTMWVSDPNRRTGYLPHGRPQDGSNSARIFCDIDSAALSVAVEGVAALDRPLREALPRTSLVKPEMEVGGPLHQRQVIDAFDSSGSLDRRNEPVEKGTQLGALG